MIRGETDHYDYVCSETARGIQDTALRTGVPCAFGVITCETREQAEARAGGDKRDQGRNAALAVMRMHLLKRKSKLAGTTSRSPAGSGRDRPLLRAATATMPPPMAKVCHSCGKKPAVGNSRSHSMVATRRRFNPNLQKVRIDRGHGPERVYVCTRCLKANKVTKAA